MHLQTDRQTSSKLAREVGIADVRYPATARQADKLANISTQAASVRVPLPDEAVGLLPIDRVIRTPQVGDRHLHAMLSEPEAYGVRPGLVEQLLAAFFKVFYAPGHTFQHKVMLTVLEGYIAPTALLNIRYVAGEASETRLCHGFYPAVVPLGKSKGDPSFLVNHPEAARDSLAAMASALATSMGGDALFEAEVAQRAADIVQSGLAHTVALMAPGAETVEVKISAERLPM